MRRSFLFSTWLAAMVFAKLVAVGGETDLTGESREWVDRSGKHHVLATASKLVDRQVVIVKANGVNVTVPLEKLSHKDLSYVASLLTDRVARISLPVGTLGPTASPQEHIEFKQPGAFEPGLLKPGVGKMLVTIPGNFRLNRETKLQAADYFLVDESTAYECVGIVSELGFSNNLTIVSYAPVAISAEIVFEVPLTCHVLSLETRTKDNDDTLFVGHVGVAQPDWVIEKRVRYAVNRLKLAKSLYEVGAVDKAEPLLLEIAERFPETDAAREANELLRRP